MGVTGLWPLLEPVGRRVSIQTLANKRLAVDASIWLFQFMKTMRHSNGDFIKNGHLLGFFRRICRLMFNKVRPIFVFDGATPALKRSTNAARRRRREVQAGKVRKTAEKMLLTKLKAHLLQEEQAQRAAKAGPKPLGKLTHAAATKAAAAAAAVAAGAADANQAPDAAAPRKKGPKRRPATEAIAGPSHANDPDISTAAAAAATAAAAAAGPLQASASDRADAVGPLRYGDTGPTAPYGDTGYGDAGASTSAAHAAGPSRLADLDEDSIGGDAMLAAQLAVGFDGDEAAAEMQQVVELAQGPAARAPAGPGIVLPSLRRTVAEPRGPGPSGAGGAAASGYASGADHTAGDMFAQGDSTSAAGPSQVGGAGAGPSTSGKRTLGQAMEDYEVDLGPGDHQDKAIRAAMAAFPETAREIQQAQRCTGQSQKKRRAYSKYDKDDDWAVEGQEDNDDEDEGDEDAGDDGDGDNLASDSGDDEEIDINAILESGHEGTLDPEALSGLPPSMQLDIIKRVRDRQIAANRVKFQEVTDDIAGFSNVQMETYLKRTQFRRNVDAIRDKMNADAGFGEAGAKPVAALAGRKYVLTDLAPAVQDGSGASWRPSLQKRGNLSDWNRRLLNGGMSGFRKPQRPATQVIDGVSDGAKEMGSTANRMVVQAPRTPVPKFSTQAHLPPADAANVQMEDKVAVTGSGAEAMEISLPATNAAELLHAIKGEDSDSQGEDDFEWEVADGNDTLGGSQDPANLSKHAVDLAGDIAGMQDEHWRKRATHRQQFWSQAHGFRFGRKLADWNAGDDEDEGGAGTPPDALNTQGMQPQGTDEDLMQQAIMQSLETQGSAQALGDGTGLSSYRGATTAAATAATAAAAAAASAHGASTSHAHSCLSPDDTGPSSPHRGAAASAGGASTSRAHARASQDAVAPTSAASRSAAGLGGAAPSQTARAPDAVHAWDFVPDWDDCPRSSARAQGTAASMYVPRVSTPLAPAVGAHTPAASGGAAAATAAAAAAAAPVEVSDDEFEWEDVVSEPAAAAVPVESRAVPDVVLPCRKPMADEERAEASRRLQRNIAYLEDDDTPCQQAERPADDAPSVIARVNAASHKLLQDHLDPPRTAPAGQPAGQAGSDATARPVSSAPTSEQPQPSAHPAGAAPSSATPPASTSSPPPPHPLATRSSSLRPLAPAVLQTATNPSAHAGFSAQQAAAPHLPSPAELHTGAQSQQPQKQQQQQQQQQHLDQGQQVDGGAAGAHAVRDDGLDIDEDTLPMDDDMLPSDEPALRRHEGVSRTHGDSFGEAARGSGERDAEEEELEEEELDLDALQNAGDDVIAMLPPELQAAVHESRAARAAAAPASDSFHGAAAAADARGEAHANDEGDEDDDDAFVHVLEAVEAGLLRKSQDAAVAGQSQGGAGGSQGAGDAWQAGENDDEDDDEAFAQALETAEARMREDKAAAAAAVGAGGTLLGVPAEEAIRKTGATVKAAAAAFQAAPAAQMSDFDLDASLKEVMGDAKELKFLNRKGYGQIEEPTTDMYRDCQELLQLFGIPYIIAPMEAEAQCAWLNEQGLVDGVVTDDNDAFLFGASHVYRHLFEEHKYVEEYIVSDMERELGMTREKLTHLALLLGSDYTEGISGIGIVNAMETVHAFPTLEDLKAFKAWLQSPDTNLLAPLEKRNRKLAAADKAEQPEPAVPTGASTSAAAAASANASASPGATPSTATAAAAGGTESGGEPANRVHYKATHRTVMKNWDLPDDFPNAQVVRAYMVPNVDSDKSKFEFGRPDSDLLATFCQERFGWSTDQVATLLTPVLKSYDERQTQRQMSDFLKFSQRFAKIRSKRLQAAVAGVTGAPLAAELVLGVSDLVAPAPTADTPAAENLVAGGFLAPADEEAAAKAAQVNAGAAAAAAAAAGAQQQGAKGKGKAHGKRKQPMGAAATDAVAAEKPKAKSARPSRKKQAEQDEAAKAAAAPSPAARSGAAEGSGDM